MAEYSLADLDQAARQWWQRLPPGSVLWLSGELGSGKTTVVQALARAAGAEPARSPSFALIHQYRSPQGPIVHVDCYRLRRPEEALDLDLVSLAASARLLAIEWPERAGPYAPRPDLHLTLRYASRPDCREIEELR